MKEDKSVNRIKKYLAALLGCIVAVGIDQLTKWMAVAFLKGQEPVVLIPGVFQLYYLENRGAAFGILQNRQYLLAFGAILIFVAVAVVYGKIPDQKRFFPLRVCAVLLASGAVGNLIDRLMLKYVVDFFYFNLIDFPIFNVADCYVVIGCILFGYLILFYYKENEFDWITWRKSDVKGK